MGATRLNRQYSGDCNHVKYTYYAIYFLNTEIQYIRRWDFRQMRRKSAEPHKTRESFTGFFILIQGWIIFMSPKSFK